MDGNEFASIRHVLGKSQRQLSRTLCISVKALQSFEQGWRKVPAHMEREMLLLLSLKHNTALTKDMPECCDVNDCPAEWREKCVVWELQTAIPCWYLNGTYCQGEYQKSWEEKIKLCRRCDVFRSGFPDPLFS